MTMPVFIGEHLSLGAPVTVVPSPGSIWRFTIRLSRPPTSSLECDAFKHSYTMAMQSIGHSVIGFTCSPDSTDIHAIVQYGFGGQISPVVLGASQTIAGVSITLEDAEEISEKKLSTGAVVGIGAAVVIAGGTVVYLVTRKNKRRRRAA